MEKIVLHDWPFDQKPDVAAVTTRQVLDGLPILRVTHYSDDESWAFVCGTTNASEDARVIGMGEAVAIDPSIREVADLPPGWSASRSKPGGTWSRSKADR